MHKIKNKVLVIKDFTTVLQMRAENRAEIFGVLRDVHDGSFIKEFGTGQPVVWEGKIGLIAAVTPEIERYTALNQVLGERFIYYRMVMNGTHKIALKSYDNTMTGDDDDRTRGGVQEAVSYLLSLFDGVELEKDKYASDDMRYKIATLSDFCAMCRTPVVRDHRDRDLVDILPEQEGPARVTKQLTLLAISLATIRGLYGVDEGIYRVLCKVVMDMLPSRRSRLIRLLVELRVENVEQYYSVEVISVKAGVNSHTCRFDLEDLFMLGLVDKKPTFINNKVIYQASDRLLIASVESEIFQFE